MKDIKEFVNKIICGDCLEVMKEMPDESIDMVLTSPPYDDLRDYKGYTFNFEGIAKELNRIIKQGGVIVWVVKDSVKDGKTLTSFKQALHFQAIGLNCHDIIIWEKDAFSFPDKTRYRDVFEYVFIFAKGKPKIINIIKDRKNKWVGSIVHGTSRGKDGETFKKSNHNRTNVKEYGARYNIWQIPSEKNNLYNHPAPFPLKLANDCINSWSNKGAIVLDCMMGSGTTCISAKQSNRKYIGIDISQEYCDIANERLRQEILL